MTATMFGDSITTDFPALLYIICTYRKMYI